MLCCTLEDKKEKTPANQTLPSPDHKRLRTELIPLVSSPSLAELIIGYCLPLRFSVKVVTSFWNMYPPPLENTPADCPIKSYVEHNVVENETRYHHLISLFPEWMNSLSWGLWVVDWPSPHPPRTFPTLTDYLQFDGTTHDTRIVLLTMIDSQRKPQQELAEAQHSTACVTSRVCAQTVTDRLYSWDCDCGQKQLCESCAVHCHSTHGHLVKKQEASLFHRPCHCSSPHSPHKTGGGCCIQ